VALIVVCSLGVAWTCNGVLSGHRVSSYTFEEAMRLARQPGPQAAACLQLRLRIVEAVKVLRQSGQDGQIAIEAIHKETR